MKQFLKIFLASLLALFFFCFLFFVLIASIASFSGDSTTTVKSNSVLVVDLNQTIAEQSQDDFLEGLNNQPSSAGLNDILTSIQRAKTDDKIKGIYVKLGVCPNGWSTLHEIHSALKDFKNTKKFIYSYGEIADQKSMYIASACTKSYVNPQGGAEVKGLAIAGMFFKGTLDKLDIKTEAFHCGQFKGAHEPWSRTDFSDANRMQMKKILDDLYSHLLTAFSEKSGKDTATLVQIINQGGIRFPKDAVREKLLDGVVYVDSVENMMRMDLGIKMTEKISYVKPSEYMEGSTVRNSAKDKIAILYAQGSINDGEGDEDIYSKNMIREIRKIAADDHIKACVLRVNSPGGSALASEVIYHELLALHKKKPVVVSMGDYAASGGYYIAMASDSILADANTLTGSIGVVGVLMNVGEFYKNKLGITTDVIKTSPYSDFPNLTRPMTDGERIWIQNYLDSTYMRFKSIVAQNRKMDMNKVEELAQGHVYTGKTALSLGLVDALGSKERAIQSAAQLAKLKEYKIVEYPQTVDGITRLVNKLKGQQSEEAVMKKMLGDDYLVFKELKKIREVNNKAQMIMPWLLDIQ